MRIKSIVLFCCFVLIATCLHADYNAAGNNTNKIEQKRYYRHIYFKMPLSPIEFHWEFLDRKQLLKGELVLKFTSKGKTVKETVFAHGTLSPNWKVVSDSDKEEADNAANNIIYFAFESKKRYWLTKNDSATLTFSTLKALHGWGPDFRAQLPAGQYKASSVTFDLYDDDSYENKKELTEASAFLELENWNKRWNLQNIVKPGW